MRCFLYAKPVIAPVLGGPDAEGNPIYREGPHAKTVISMGTTPSSTISSCLAAA